MDDSVAFRSSIPIPTFLWRDKLHSLSETQYRRQYKFSANLLPVSHKFKYIKIWTLDAQEKRSFTVGKVWTSVQYGKLWINIRDGNPIKFYINIFLIE